MSRRSKILIAIAVVWLGGTILLAVAFGIHGQKNSEYQIQNEFQQTKWVDLGVLSITRAVFYLFLTALLTVSTMLYIANRMQARPNRVQTAVEVLYSLMRENITRGNMSDALARKWFPFCGTLFLFIWWANMIGYLPLPTNTQDSFMIAGVKIPSFALYAATANISTPFILALVVFIAYNWEGVRHQGPIGYMKSLVPGGIGGIGAILIGVLEGMSNLMRLLSLTIRLWANIFAGHMIILFMSGALAVILGLSFLGWFTMPFAVAVYVFELGLVATLQAFIFATLAAIYLGGAVQTH